MGPLKEVSGTEFLYRDTVIGAVFGSYESLLGNEVEDMDEEGAENTKEKHAVDEEEGVISISFSKEEKQLLGIDGKRTLIIKLFGKILGTNT